MRTRAIAAALVLGCVIGIVYAPVLDHDFVEFDDPLYVTENVHVARGLTPATVGWAFGNDVAFVWHPLTWLSYLADAQLHGIERAGPWLATNVLLHALTAGLLLVWLAERTRRLAAAILVAGLFALHPLQVEAVAWVSARKEVLSGLFLVLTLAAYGAHAQRPTRARYALLLVAYAACLLAKGTLVGLPLVLLALDFWPLRRMALGGTSAPAVSAARPLRSLVLEKLPLLALASVDLAIQLAFVSRSENVWASDPPLLERVPVAIMALGSALGRVLWPRDLAISYPTPLQMGLDPWPATTLIAVAAALAGIAIGAIGLARRLPPIAVGVVWFFVLLAPLSGIVPAGLRSMHDRYTYIPLIGIAIALVFGIDAALRGRSTLRRVGLAGVGLALVACAVDARQQLRVWSDSESLFGHALDVTERNAVVRYSRGIARAKAGRVPEAVADLEAALAVHPDHADAHASLGFLLAEHGALEDALPHLERAVDLRPDWALARTNLARALEARGDRQRALESFEIAVEIAPDSADAHYWLGTALARRGRLDAAAEQLRTALEIEPEHRWAREALMRLSGSW